MSTGSIRFSFISHNVMTVLYSITAGQPQLLIEKSCLQQKGAPLTLPAMLDPS